jgi:hypothetical protein
MELTSHPLGYDVTYGYYRDGFISKSRTRCCALAQLSLENSHTKQQIQTAIDEIKKENETPVNSMRRDGGERAVFVVTLPHETKLVENLIELGFKEIAEFHRRNCYPEDSMLKMWIISW